ncbi:uncharacterized protein FIBRA_08904 [Fibroporia radiculosa]|uniref:Uncharacterized protein n=1 Tax=Fibroporia radiculosa TaxID=599839 RepID=J4H5F0_9APHY|nr:uncharacterized protein FIBRA_08904 [Fibroporia radiculosa]CCM06624.1 predicted protein [Fibroporia radiculosa]
MRATILFFIATTVAASVGVSATPASYHDGLYARGDSAGISPYGDSHLSARGAFLSKAKEKEKKKTKDSYPPATLPFIRPEPKSPARDDSPSPYSHDALLDYLNRPLPPLPHAENGREHDHPDERGPEDDYEDSWDRSPMHDERFMNTWTTTSELCSRVRSSICLTDLAINGYRE